MLWKRLNAAAALALQQRITAAGLLFAMVVALVGLAAFASANNLLFLIFAALLATLLISGFVSRLGLAGLEISLVLPEHIAARQKVLGRVIVRNTKLWMPSFSLHLQGSGASTPELYFPVIPSRTTLEEPIELRFERRGLYLENHFQFSSRFPFGFTHRRAGVLLRHDVLVYPAIAGAGEWELLLADIAGELESIYRGRGHDFYRIRPYESSESARSVDWKATAHTGELQVREFSREDERSITIFLDLDVPEAQAEWFESAVECSAFLVWRLSRQEARVRLRTQQFDRQVPEEADPYTILKYLALVTPVSGAAPLRIDENRDLQIAITARPDRLAAAGWARAHLLGPDRLGGRPAGPRAGQDLDHHRRAD